MTAEGFTYYAAVKVSRVEDLPEGMASVAVPALAYATCEHRAGSDISASYARLMDWLRN